MYFEFTIGKWTVGKDHWGWYRKALKEEMSHPHSYSRFGLSPFEKDMMEALIAAKPELTRSKDEIQKG